METQAEQQPDDLPSTIEPEQATLGALLIDPQAITLVVDLLEPSDFWMPQHQAIYAAMLRLHARGQPPDLVLLDQELNGDMAAAGGIAYLATLPTLTPSSLHLMHYAGLVHEASRRRLLMETGQKMAAGAVDVDRAVDEAESMLAEVRRRRAAVEWEDRLASLDRLDDRLFGDLSQDDTGILTGLPSLDTLTQGFRRGDLIIVGARPGIGKTSLAVTTAHHFSVRLGERVLFFSLEMLRDRIWEKLIAVDTGIPWTRLTTRRMNEIEQADAKRALASIRSAPIDVVPAREWAIEHIRTAAAEANKQAPLSLIVVDYLQLVTVQSRRDNREQVVSAISAGLKNMALELECPVMALAQLNRESEHRPGGLPQLADLRESGAQEMDADIALLLSWNEDDARQDPPPPIVRVMVQVAKNRMGERGGATLGLRGPQMQFVELGHGGLPF